MTTSPSPFLCYQWLKLPPWPTLTINNNALVRLSVLRSRSMVRPSTRAEPEEVNQYESSGVSGPHDGAPVDSSPGVPGLRSRASFLIKHHLIPNRKNT